MNKIIGKKRNNLNKAIKAIDENNLGSIVRIFLCSFVVIFFFYSLPLVINFTNNKILNANEFRNNSKIILAYTLDKKNNTNLNEKEVFNESDLLVWLPVETVEEFKINIEIM